MQSRTSQLGILAQFLLSYCIVGILAALVSILLTTMHTRLPISILAGGLVGGCIGLLLTWNIQGGLAQLEQALAHLAQNLPLEDDAHRIHWPLDPLFVQTHLLSKQMVAQTQMDRPSSTLRLRMQSYKSSYNNENPVTNSQREN